MPSTRLLSKINGSLRGNVRKKLKISLNNNQKKRIIKQVLTFMMYLLLAVYEIIVQIYLSSSIETFVGLDSR